MTARTRRAHSKTRELSSNCCSSNHSGEDALTLVVTPPLDGQHFAYACTRILWRVPQHLLVGRAQSENLKLQATADKGA